MSVAVKHDARAYGQPARQQPQRDLLDEAFNSGRSGTREQSHLSQEVRQLNMTHSLRPQYSQGALGAFSIEKSEVGGPKGEKGHAN
jgi:hypothetical protein